MPSHPRVRGVYSEREGMSDLELTKLCAEAMGWSPCGVREDFESVKALPVAQFPGAPAYQYAPLKSDSSAMALVKKFRLDITNFFGSNDNFHEWSVRGTVAGLETSVNADLNRAIVECVAKMQAIKPTDAGNERGKG